MIDLDAIERFALQCTAGGRAAEPHTFRPKTESVLVDDDGDALAEGRTAEIELMAALPPKTLIHLINLARLGAKAAAVQERNARA